MVDFVRFSCVWFWQVWYDALGYVLARWGMFSFVLAGKVR